MLPDRQSRAEQSDGLVPKAWGYRVERGGESRVEGFDQTAANERKAESGNAGAMPVRLAFRLASVITHSVGAEHCSFSASGVQDNLGTID